MESFALLPVTIASIFASFSGGDVPIEESVIRTHISPEIAGLWELEPETRGLFGIDRDKESEYGTDVVLTDITPEQSSLLEIDSVVSVLEQSKIRRISDTDATSLYNDDGTNDNSVKALNNVPNSANQACQERYNFGSDNFMLTTSGEEWTSGNYVYQHQEEGLPMLVIVTIYDNNKVDCAGQQVDQAGEAAVLFVDYQPDKNKMVWCTDREGANCLMSFRRLLP